MPFIGGDDRKSPIETPVILMQSGGVRSEEGDVRSFFMRQSPQQVPWNTNDKASNSNGDDKLTPWATRRITPPESFFRNHEDFNKVAPSLKEFRASTEYVETEKRKSAKVVMPNVVKRIFDILYAKIERKVPHGWSYEQRNEPDGTYSVDISRLFVNNHQKPVDGTQVILPTRKMELYEFEHLHTASAPSSAHHSVLPVELEKMRIFLPIQNAIVQAYTAGKITKKAIVDCHELGKKYLLYRSRDVAESARTLDEKKRLLIFAHGMERKKRMSFPKDVSFSFYTPPGTILFSPLSLTDNPIDAIYSTHAGGDSYVPQDLTIQKCGSPVHDARTKRQRYSSAMNNPNEGAAWVAHDNGIDVLLVRQGRHGSVRNVVKELTKKGLISEYSNILIHACRSKGPTPKVYGISNNYKKMDSQENEYMV